MYQTKQFKRWNKKNKIPNDKLVEAIKSIDIGSGIVNLSSNLYKIRIEKGKGKSSGYRTIIIHKKDFRSLIVHGYEKNEKANITAVELKEAKQFATDFLNFSDDFVKKLLESNFIFRLEEQ